MGAFPNELLERILKLLHRADLVKCSIASRRLHDLVSPILFTSMVVTMPQINKYYRKKHFYTKCAIAAKFGQHVRSLRVKSHPNFSFAPKEGLALANICLLLKWCPMVTKLEMHHLSCTEEELCAVLSQCRHLQSLELIRIRMLVSVPRLITAILPLVGSLQILNLDFWPDPCKWTDIAALHRVVPSLTALSLTVNHDSWVFPRLFLESKHHRADHDPDCDACTNPWLSVTSLTINMVSFNTRVSELPATIAFLCLKFPNLQKLAITCGRDSFLPHPDPKFLTLWRSLLDPTIAHWPSLMSLALTHTCAGVILDAVYQFTSVGGVSMSPLASLTVETVKDFASTYTMGLLTAFPSLYKLKIVNDWPDLIYNATAPPLPLASLPPPSFGHPLYDLHVMSVNMAILLRISELCPQLNSVTLVFNRRWGMRGEVSLLAWRDGEIPPDEYMPSHLDQLPIVQKFKQNQQNTADNKVFWILLPYSTRLTSLTVITAAVEWVIAYYIQNPPGGDVGNNDPLDFTGSYVIDRQQIHVSHPDAAFETDSSRAKENSNKDKQRTMIIVAPCRANVLNLKKYHFYTAN